MGAARLAAVASLSVCALSGCDDLCANTPLGEATAPDGRTIATSFERNCGATTPFVRIVSLRRADANQDLSDDDGWVLTLKGQPEIRLGWNGPTALDVQIIGPHEVFREKGRWKDVVIAR